MAHDPTAQEKCQTAEYLSLREALPMVQGSPDAVRELFVVCHDIRGGGGEYGILAHGRLGITIPETMQLTASSTHKASLPSRAQAIDVTPDCVSAGVVGSPDYDSGVLPPIDTAGPSLAEIGNALRATAQGQIASVFVHVPLYRNRP